ncbi:MAG: COG2426 family protein [Christensenellales bacterium]|jgi:uncharacterized membrane protein
MDWFQSFIAGLSTPLAQRLAVVLCSALPIVELKGAIPMGLAFGIPLWETYLLANLGCALPVIPIMLFMQPVIRWMYTKRLFKRFAAWVDGRTQRKKGMVQKFEYLGLFIFVAIPLPTTGVWTGSMIASVLRMPIVKAAPTVILGNLVAGLIMLLSGFFIR